MVRRRVRHQPPRPGPATRGSPRSSWRTWPHLKLRRKAPRACPRESGGGGRLSRETENAGGPAGAQRIGVVDAVATGQRGGHQRHHLVAGVGSACCMAQVQAPANQLGQAQGEGGRKDQPGIGHQVVIVEGDADAVGGGWRGSIYWALLFWGRFSVSKPLSQKHGSTFLPLQNVDPTPSFGGFGLSVGRS